MIHPNWRVSAAFLFIVASTLSTAAQEEQQIPCKDAPKPVIDAFKAAYPSASITGCAKEFDKGQPAFEVASREGKVGRDIVYHPDGKVMVVEETLPFAEVPQAVRDAVRKNYPGAEITLAEKLMRDGTLKYEFQMTAKGKTQEAVFEPDGKEETP
jgi:hypothetical protein